MWNPETQSKEPRNLSISTMKNLGNEISSPHGLATTVEPVRIVTQIGQNPLLKVADGSYET